MGGCTVIHEHCLNPDCQRPLSDPASRRRGFGRKCWEDRLAAARETAVRIYVANVNRRWAVEMPGQEEHQIEEPTA
jgi:GNAT superfamily N-acetyltransferase